MEDTCGTPENFFRNCYVHNYCPISMMTATAKNITPPQLRIAERKEMLDICDDSLCSVILLLKVQIIVGIGKFAEERAKEVLREYNVPGVTVVGIMHPSPINPAANKGWKDIARTQLETSGVLQYLVG